MFLGAKSYGRPTPCSIQVVNFISKPCMVIQVLHVDGVGGHVVGQHEFGARPTPGKIKVVNFISNPIVTDQI